MASPLFDMTATPVQSILTGPGQSALVASLRQAPMVDSCWKAIRRSGSHLLVGIVVKIRPDAITQLAAPFHERLQQESWFADLDQWPLFVALGRQKNHDITPLKTPYIAWSTERIDDFLEACIQPLEFLEWGSYFERSMRHYLAQHHHRLTQFDAYRARENQRHKDASTAADALSLSPQSHTFGSSKVGLSVSDGKPWKDEPHCAADSLKINVSATLHVPLEFIDRTESAALASCVNEALGQLTAALEKLSTLPVASATDEERELAQMLGPRIRYTD